MRIENCGSPSFISFFAPQMSKDTELWRKAGLKSPSGLRPWTLSPFFIWSRPPVAMVTQHLLPNSAPAVTGFGILQAVVRSVFCLMSCSAPRGMHHTFSAKECLFKTQGYGEKEVKSVQAAILRQQALLHVGPLTLPISGLMFCICWSQILLKIILLDLLAFVSKEHTLFIKTSKRYLKYI